jgi:uncharacterized protein (TIGR02646 family)
MIRVKRTSGPPPGIEKLAAEEEALNMRSGFTVYKHQRIKDALGDLFRGKCAYCESPIRATQPMDVEHWRPKSLYPFLAAEWTNLLPSCIDCNRRRTHKIPMPDGSTREIALGKLDDFPLPAGVKRASTRKELDNEQPLILHPCEDDPTEHLEFTQQAVVRAKPGKARGEESIRVYALNRMGLVHERYERKLIVGRHIHVIRILAAAWERERNKKRQALFEDLIAYEMSAIRTMCQESQPYCQFVRQLVDEFLASADGLPEWLKTR